mgnify:CR=1 FL=1
MLVLPVEASAAAFRRPVGPADAQREAGFQRDVVQLRTKVKILRKIPREASLELSFEAIPVDAPAGLSPVRGRASLGFLAILGGLALLVGGASTAVIALGVAGFVVMLVGAIVVYSAFSRRATSMPSTLPRSLISISARSGRVRPARSSASASSRARPQTV